MLRFDIITIFPDMFGPILNESIIKRAQENKKVVINIHDLRDYTDDKKHRKVDDRPFCGGPGMLMMPQPLFDAIKAIKGRRKVHVIYTSPAGKTFTQFHAKRLTKVKNLIMICGHYEGIDERVLEHLVDEEISVGDYVLTGGELPAMLMVDAVTRLLPGVLGKEASLVHESFEGNVLEGPQYTRPADFRGKSVPDVLLSGNHKAIEKWRHEKALAKTKLVRPDLSLRQRQTDLSTRQAGHGHAMRHARAGRRDRRLARRPALRGRHLQRGDALRLGLRYLRRAAHGFHRSVQRAKHAEVGFPALRLGNGLRCGSYFLDCHVVSLMAE